MSLENIIATRTVEVGPVFTVFGTPQALILTVRAQTSTGLSGFLESDPDLVPLWLNLLEQRAGAASEEGEAVSIDLAVTDSKGEDEPPTHTYTLTIRTLSEGSTDVRRASKYIARDIEVPAGSDPIQLTLADFDLV